MLTDRQVDQMRWEEQILQDKLVPSAEPGRLAGAVPSGVVGGPELKPNEAWVLTGRRARTGTCAAHVSEPRLQSEGNELCAEFSH